LILKLLTENRFPDLAAVQGAARSACSATPPSSVGAHAHPHTKRPAGHRLGEWITTRS
jgi:hypothetical protein